MSTNETNEIKVFLKTPVENLNFNPGIASIGLLQCAMKLPYIMSARGAKMGGASIYQDLISNHGYSATLLFHDCKSHFR